MIKVYLHINSICNINMINVDKPTPMNQEQALSARFGYLGLDAARPAEILGLLLRHLEADHGFSYGQLRKLIASEKEAVHIPLSIFSDRLSALETVVKYMSENLGMRNCEISRLLNRNLRTTWTTYKNASRKFPERFSLAGIERFHVPAARLADRTHSTLEAIVSHLKEDYRLSLHEIALLLKRDDSTIWTICSRAKKKALRKS
jgi:hypothetical protein